MLSPLRPRRWHPQDARDALRAARTDPNRLLAALAGAGDAALFDALLADVRVEADEAGWQRLAGGELGGAEHAHALLGLVAVAPEGSAAATRLRDTLRAPRLVGAGGRPVSCRLVSRLPAMERLCIEQAAVLDLAALRACPGLAALTLRRCLLPRTALADLAGSRLQSLEIFGSAPGACPTALDAAGLSHLGALALEALPDLARVDGLPAGLRSLRLRACSALGALPDLPAGLRRLELADCPAVVGLDPVAGAADLESLSLAGSPWIEDLSPLSDLACLRTVDLRGCRAVSDLAPLADLPLLRAVATAGSGVDLAALPAALSQRCAADPGADLERLCRPLPPVPAALRQPVTALRGLLRSGDAAQAAQAVELAEALADPALAAALLEGTALVEEGGWQRLVPGPLLDAQVRGSSRQIALALPALLALADPASAAGRLRDRVTALHLKQPAADLEPLAAFPALRRLRLEGCKRLERADALSRLPLEELDLDSCLLPADLRLPPTLRALALTGVAWPDLAPLAGLAQLEALALTGARCLVTLDGLPTARLRRLQVEMSPSLTDISTLRGCGALAEARLWGCPAVLDRSALPAGAARP